MARPAPALAPWSELVQPPAMQEGAVEDGERRQVERHGHLGAADHLEEMDGKAEPGDVGAGVGAGIDVERVAVVMGPAMYPGSMPE